VTQHGLTTEASAVPGGARPAPHPLADWNLDVDHAIRFEDVAERIRNSPACHELQLAAFVHGAIAGLVAGAALALIVLA
jgi:hypothetical protein